MNMKVLYRILSGACMTLLFIACEDESSATPYARMTVDKTTLQLNESMVVKFTAMSRIIMNYGVRTIPVW